MIGVAPTGKIIIFLGSGKSLAFLAPMIAYLQTLPCLDDYTCKDGPLGLIMTPTRELAIQIDKEF
jgi:superfamily II DNA/RNA helicase